MICPSEGATVLGTCAICGIRPRASVEGACEVCDPPLPSPAPMLEGDDPRPFLPTDDDADAFGGPDNVDAYRMPEDTDT